MNASIAVKNSFVPMKVCSMKLLIAVQAIIHCLFSSVHFTESRTSFTEEEDYIPDISSEVTQSKQSKESYELHNRVESFPDGKY